MLNLYLCFSNLIKQNYYFYYEGGATGGDVHINSVHPLPRNQDQMVVCNRTNTVVIMNMQVGQPLQPGQLVLNYSDESVPFSIFYIRHLEIIIFCNFFMCSFLLFNALLQLFS